DVVIVGAGHGGTQAAIALRRGFGGSIALISDEVELPYERPPLSKEHLAGEKPFSRILIRPESFYGERAITLLLGQRVIAVEAEAHRVALSDGIAIGYQTLISATGRRTRRLSCACHDMKASMSCGPAQTSIRSGGTRRCITCGSDRRQLYQPQGCSSAKQTRQIRRSPPGAAPRSVASCRRVALALLRSEE